MFHERKYRPEKKGKPNNPERSNNEVKGLGMMVVMKNANGEVKSKLMN